MKKIFVFIFILVISFILTSCFDSEPKKLEEKKNVNNFSEDLSDVNIDDVIKNQVNDVKLKVEKGEISKQEAKKIILDNLDKSEDIKAQLEKFKKDYSKILEVMKLNRECIKNAVLKTDVIECSKKSTKKVKQLHISKGFFNTNTELNEDFLWNNSEKKKIITTLDTLILKLESGTTCIKNSQVISEAMKCMQNK